MVPGIQLMNAVTCSWQHGNYMKDLVKRLANTEAETTVIAGFRFCMFGFINIRSLYSLCFWWKRKSSDTDIKSSSNSSFTSAKILPDL